MRKHFVRQIALCFVALALLVTPARVKASTFSCSLSYAGCRTSCFLNWLDPDPPNIDGCLDMCEFNLAWCLYFQDV